jgi:hypothetical protein
MAQTYVLVPEKEFKIPVSSSFDSTVSSIVHQPFKNPNEKADALTVALTNYIAHMPKNQIEQPKTVPEPVHVDLTPFKPPPPPRRNHQSRRTLFSTPINNTPVLEERSPSPVQHKARERKVYEKVPHDTRAARKQAGGFTLWR